MLGGAFWHYSAGKNTPGVSPLECFRVDALIQGLWVRLSSRPDFKLGLEASAKLFIWELVHCLPQVIN